MRRFRKMRRRAAVLALLPLAALTTTTSLAAETGAERAQIESSTRSVAIGERVTLHGRFPGAAKAAVEIRHRAKRSSVWHEVGRTRTGASGRYQVRVRPRESGHWRAELAGKPVTQNAPALAEPTASTASAVDRGTGSERISVRSKTTATVQGRHALVGRTVRVEGTVAPAGVKRRVVVRVGGSQQITRAGRDGRFSVAWKAPSTGTYPVRVSARSNRVATGSRERAGKVTVYRPAAASWYGPGLYGNALGCGGTLTPSTLGVANKSLPCGTKLTLRYGGRSVRVRVIDRGPYAGNREFDLTSATKQRLGFPDVGTVLSSR